MRHTASERPEKWFEQVLRMRVKRHPRHAPVWVVLFFFVSLVLAAVGNLLL
ncbi:hypothetical protein NFC81_00895 [Salinispirillum sp. LH 10-3-1]|uniref:DUF3094 family protein n=1 Tax=Salinispirillum sp. LH 10-3-1 TaxID=2952525 RepID=A0AB38YH19_9GAMM